ncbi:glycosyltransferase [Candidatus Daviesbacteria bacterium]|nr:glycosyltransferase [Candidatus Daviesbacteria bacterium]
MKIALVHDDLVQWGGAERVFEGLTKIFPEAPIYTSLYDENNVELFKRFKGKRIITSFVQKIPGWRQMYKGLLPLYPIAFEQFDFSDYDFVISHSTRFAKNIITKPNTRHFCYCHTPPRFLWNLSNEKVNNLLEPYLSFLRVADQIFSNRVDKFLAGSKNAQDRIKKIYHKDSDILYPFVDLARFQNITAFDGGYMMVIARLNYYKRVDLVIKACQKLDIPLKIIGSGSLKDSLENLSEKGNTQIEFLENLDESILLRVLSGAKALIIPGIEDFGLASLEAQAFGKPVIAYGQGGVLETVVEGKTGIFFDKQDVNSLVRAIEKLENLNIDPNACIENTCLYSFEKFEKNVKTIIST